MQRACDSSAGPHPFASARQSAPPRRLRAYLTTGAAGGQDALRLAMRFRDGSELQLIRPRRAAGPSQQPDLPHRQQPAVVLPQATPEQALRSFLLAVEAPSAGMSSSSSCRAPAPPRLPARPIRRSRSKRFTGPRSPTSPVNTALRQHWAKPIQAQPQQQQKPACRVGIRCRLLLEEVAGA